MRTMAARILILALLAALPERALAASVCTSFMEFKGDRDACINMIRERTSSAGLKHNLAGDTLIFWFDDDVVTARCIANYSIIAFSAYHRQNDQACPLSDRIFNTLR
jgi:hypothetical protein